MFPLCLALTFESFIINTEGRKISHLMLSLPKPVCREGFLSLKVNGTNWRALEQDAQYHWNNEGYLFCFFFKPEKVGI